MVNMAKSDNQWADHYLDQIVKYKDMAAGAGILLNEAYKRTPKDAKDAAEICAAMIEDAGNCDEHITYEQLAYSIRKKFGI